MAPKIFGHWRKPKNDVLYSICWKRHVCTASKKCNYKFSPSSVNSIQTSSLSKGGKWKTVYNNSFTTLHLLHRTLVFWFVFWQYERSPDVTRRSVRPSPTIIIYLFLIYTKEMRAQQYVIIMSFEIIWKMGFVGRKRKKNDHRHKVES